MDHVAKFFAAAAEICKVIDTEAIDRLADELVHLRNHGGRLFIVGNGGGAAHASHAVNDFRKLCGIEAYTPTDNVAELTARINDDGWDTVYSAWLRTSDFCSTDALMVFSVGGGNVNPPISTNIVKALELAVSRRAKIFAVVGRAEGYAAQLADVSIIIPSPNPEWITPMTEAFQALVWHALVSYPRLQLEKTKW